MKDVPTQLPKGIVQSAVLKRASYKDLFVYKGDRPDLKEALGFVNGQGSIVNSQWAMVNKENLQLTTHNSQFTIHNSQLTIATSSIRRKAQWLNRYPNHIVENLRGNVNTRLRKVAESNWDGAIFAAAGLERIGLRPETSIELDWMVPAPAQGAIVVVCREEDVFSYEICKDFNDSETALCTKIEKDFLRILLGGCSTPISALAEIKNETLFFKGNILAVDGSKRVDIEKVVSINEAENLGKTAALEILANGGRAIAAGIHHER